jgi:putative flippase GtrA
VFPDSRSALKLVAGRAERLPGGQGMMADDVVAGVWGGALLLTARGLGSLSNFSINRRWAFGDSSVRSHKQFLRFVLVQAGASGLHTLGVWLVTRFLRIPYPISKLIVAAMVGVGWNYPMNHFFVFATAEKLSGGGAS